MTSRQKLIIIAMFAAIASATACIVYYVIEPEAQKNSAPPPPPPDVNVELFMRLLPNSTAKCIDGSAAGYYFRAPDNTTTDEWVIFLQGGGICTSPTTCQERAFTPLGSSQYWMIYNNNPPPILRNDDDLNPFKNANHIWIPYCSGDAFAGNKTYEDYSLTFNGHEIVKSVVADLLTWGLANASHVLLTGESAGGLGTFFNADAVAEQIRAETNKQDVVIKASPLGGYYFAQEMSDFLGWSQGNYDEDFGLGKARDLQAFFDGVPDTSCAAAHPTNLAECFTVGRLLKYIQTPLLIAENLYDPSKIVDELGLEPGKNVTEDELYSGYYAEKVVDSVLIGIANSTAVDKELNGYWLPSCGSHTENLGVGSDVMMNVTVGQGENSWELKTYRDVLWDWYYEMRNIQWRKYDDCNDDFLDGPCNDGC